jgi:hypothetical protein
MYTVSPGALSTRTGMCPPSSPDGTMIFSIDGDALASLAIALPMRTSGRAGSMGKPEPASVT